MNLRDYAVDRLEGSKDYNMSTKQSPIHKLITEKADAKVRHSTDAFMYFRKSILKEKYEIHSSENQEKQFVP